MNRRQYAIAGLSAALCAACAPVAPRPDPRTFDRTLERDGVRFRVRCENSSSLNRVRIDIHGRLGHHAIGADRAGLVTDAAVADLDADGLPELYVTSTSAGSGSYGELFGLTFRAEGGLAYIDLTDAQGTPALRGYQGHDRFDVRDRTLTRTFPVYRPGDPNARPGGGTRVLRYRLSAPGPNGPGSLELDGYTDHPAAP